MSPYSPTQRWSLCSVILGGGRRGADCPVEGGAGGMNDEALATTVAAAGDGAGTRADTLVQIADAAVADTVLVAGDRLDHRAVGGHDLGSGIDTVACRHLGFPGLIGAGGRIPRGRHDRQMGPPHSLKLVISPL